MASKHKHNKKTIKNWRHFRKIIDRKETYKNANLLNANENEEQLSFKKFSESLFPPDFIDRISINWTGVVVAIIQWHVTKALVAGWLVRRTILASLVIIVSPGIGGRIDFVALRVVMTHKDCPAETSNSGHAVALRIATSHQVGARPHKLNVMPATVLVAVVAAAPRVVDLVVPTPDGV